MDQFYLLCAVIGGTIFTGQFVFSLIGLSGDHDFAGDGGSDHFDAGGHDDATGDGHHDAGAVGHDSALWWFLSVLSFRTVIAGLTFFGLAGLAAEASGARPAGAFVIAAAAGLAALYLVAWGMRAMSRLRSDGTVRIQNAVGASATVYLTVPARRSGKGKITVTVQNRTMEYEAETEFDLLPTGTMVQVVGVVGNEILEVIPASEPARTHHV
ncbi:MAG: hypothetical protein HY290_29345 [Planctomycetia bacterium]|nr:hypothetical protein [Planctomycetia bacterium]